MKSFLMLGQSNMAGRGDFGEVPEIQNNHCYMLRNGRFIPMVEPINPDRGFYGNIHSGIGLAASFADEYAKYFNEDIGLIPCADGGTQIKEWLPGEVLYENAVIQAKFAMRSSDIVGILWHQGESDCWNKPEVPHYRERFLTLMTALFEELNLPYSTPIIIGEIGAFVKKTNNGNNAYDEVNATLKALSEELEYGAFVSAENLNCRHDGVHFDSASYREFGKRYFSSFLRVVNK